MGNPVVHWELLSKEPANLSQFYEKVFDWKIEHIPQIDYRMVNTQTDVGIKGGIINPKREGPWPGNMTVYVAVDDLAAYRKRVLAAGGRILIEEQEVPGQGKFSLFSDPDGRMMGLWKQAGM